MEKCMAENEKPGDNRQDITKFLIMTLASIVIMFIVFPCNPPIAFLACSIRTRSPDIFLAATAVFKVTVVEGICIN